MQDSHQLENKGTREILSLFFCVRGEVCRKDLQIYVQHIN